MHKLLGTTLAATTIIGLGFTASHAFANSQTISNQNSADITVNGTLGADNTDPESNIPEESDNWINVTVPTSTIFYNTPTDRTIQSPTYQIVNNSGRPVSVTASGFTDKGTNPTLPTDFDLTLDVSGTATNPSATASTSLISNGVLASPISSHLTTLANKDGQMTNTGTKNTGDNVATFTYGGSSDTSNMLSLSYNLNMTFEAVDWTK
ncbi:hypothetical protein [Lactococcus sp.]|uniref:hypothetical protein n=1 Tax=Lactococcus sp. TaxID=44273 RepID=UPI0035AE955B